MRWEFDSEHGAGAGCKTPNFEPATYRPVYTGAAPPAVGGDRLGLGIGLALLPALGPELAAELATGGSLNFDNSRAEHLALGIALLALGCMASFPWVNLCRRRRQAKGIQQVMQRADRWRARPEERQRLVSTAGGSGSVSSGSASGSDSDFDSDSNSSSEGFSAVVMRGGERGRMRQHERPPNERPKGRPRPRRPSFGADPRAVRSAEAVACRPDSAYGSRDFIQLATSCGLDLAALDALATAGRPEGEAAAVVLAQTLAASLPPPWSCHMDMTGDGADRLGGGCYYYNAQRDESQYDHPLVSLAASRLLPLDLDGALASGGWPSGEQAGGRRENPTPPPHSWPPPNCGHPAAAAAHSPIMVHQRSIAGSPATAQPATRAVPELLLHGSPPPRPQPLLVAGSGQRRNPVLAEAEERSDFEVFGEFGKFVSSSSSEDEDKGTEKGHAAGAASARPRLEAEAAIVPPPGQHPRRVAAAAAAGRRPKP